MEYQGVVKWFDPNKRFGFIAGGPEGDVFVHVRNLEAGRDELVEGQEVTFQLRASEKGDEACEVRVTRESDAAPRLRTLRPNSPGRSARAPVGAVECTVVSRDREDRFLFVQSEREKLDVFVHGSLFRSAAPGLRRGDRVVVTVEESPRGLRATSLRV